MRKKSRLLFIFPRRLTRIQKHLDPLVNNDQLLEVFRSIYDKHLTKNKANEINNNVFGSKIARRLLVLVFVQSCHEKIHDIEQLDKLLPLTFRSNQVILSVEETI